MNRKISIIVPVYNAEQYLKQCLDSVKEQSFKNFECICIDNKSTDKSRELIQRYVKNDQRFIYLQEECSGPSYARNTGLNNVTGDYITFIDADDYIADDYLEKYLHVAIENNADLVFGSYTSNEHQIENYSITDGTKYNLINNLADKTGGVVWAKLYKRAVIHNIRFDEAFKMREDLEFNLRVLNNIEKVCYINNYGYYYRVNDNSLSRKTAADISIRTQQTTQILQLLFQNQTNGDAIDIFLKKMIFWDAVSIVSMKQNLKLITDSTSFMMYKKFICCETVRDYIFFGLLKHNRIRLARMVYQFYVTRNKLLKRKYRDGNVK